MIGCFNDDSRVSRKNHTRRSAVPQFVLDRLPANSFTTYDYKPQSNTNAGDSEDFMCINCDKIGQDHLFGTKSDCVVIRETAIHRGFVSLPT